VAGGRFVGRRAGSVPALPGTQAGLTDRAAPGPAVAVAQPGCDAV